MRPARAAGLPSRPEIHSALRDAVDTRMRSLGWHWKHAPIDLSPGTLANLGRSRPSDRTLRKLAEARLGFTLQGLQRLREVDAVCPDTPAGNAGLAAVTEVAGTLAPWQQRIVLEVMRALAENAPTENA